MPDFPPPENSAQTAETAPSPTPPPQPPAQRIVLEQPGGWFGKLGKVLFVLLIISIFFNLSQFAARQQYYTASPAVQEKWHSLSKTASDKVAVIRVEGAILKGDGFVKRQIDQVRDDENVKAIVLRVDSPGGTVSGSSYIYHHLVELAKEKDVPLVVSMGGICASGGYYVSMAAGKREDAIFAEPATWTGSIGVIIPHYNLSGLLEKWNVEDDSVVSHDLKDLGSPTKDMTEEERAILQTLVDESFEEFKQVVRRGRPNMSEEKLNEVATGQVFTAEQALKHGLVDKIGFVEEAIERAIALANLDAEETRVVHYRRPPGLLDALGGGYAEAMQQPGVNLGLLLDLSAPRAYYLFTWLPSLLTSSRG